MKRSGKESHLCKSKNKFLNTFKDKKINFGYLKGYKPAKKNKIN